jgi:hypothetical protein
MRSIHLMLTLLLLAQAGAAAAQTDGETEPAQDVGGDELAPSPAAAEEPPPAPAAAEPAPYAEDTGEAPPPPPEAEERRYDGEVSAGSQRDPYANDRYEQEPDYPRPDDDDGGGGAFEMPPWSIRLDPFNWLIEGRLGFELEVGVLDWLSVELVPVFVANSEPPSFNFSGREDPISQESNGLGPIAGTSLGVGFWLGDKPLEGYVLRVVFTNYGFTYKASDSGGVYDEVEFTERRLLGYFGSHMRFGFFTLAGGIGLGYELNQQQRCFVSSVGGLAAATSGCPDEDENHIRASRATTLGGLSVADLNGPLHPIVLEGRFSLGVAFD